MGLSRLHCTPPNTHLLTGAELKAIVLSQNEIIWAEVVITRLYSIT